MRTILLTLLALISISASATPFHEISKIKDVKEKKLAFFSHIYPFVINANEKIMADRKFLLSCDNSCQNTSNYYKFIQKKYRSKDINSLLMKVDAIPVDLALNQAANESAWGGSRFSRVANNLFGMWCFTPGCGVVPLDRPKGKTYEVRLYETIQDSIEHYMLTLNTNNAYSQLREIRLGQRKEDSTLDSLSMSNGLIKYSERGTEYIHEIQSMIRINSKFINSSDVVVKI